MNIPIKYSKYYLKFIFIVVTLYHLKNSTRIVGFDRGLLFKKKKDRQPTSISHRKAFASKDTCIKEDVRLGSICRA